MKIAKRLVAIALAVMMLLGSLSVAASAWDANTNDGKTLSITTKIFRFVNNEWIETEKVKQGEEVKVRVYVNTDYYTNSGNLLFFYNNDFFTDSFGSALNTLTVSSFYAESPYRISGKFYGPDSSSGVENFLVSRDRITQEFADSHDFVNISYSFGSGLANNKLTDEHWFCEFSLTVRDDAAAGTGTGDFFALKDSTCSEDFPLGIINVPKGPYDGTNEDVSNMSLWTATLDYNSTPVTLYSNLVSATFDAANGDEEIYLEGDAGDALTIADPVRENYEFEGWKVKGADDSTAAEVTAYPSESTEYEAVWTSTTATDETLTFVTKIYRQDAETGEWIETDKVKPGENVKARLFVDTSYYTNAGNIILFYDNDFFTDSYIYDVKYDIVPNTSATSSAYINGVYGETTKIQDSNYTIKDLISNKYITEEIAANTEAITVAYYFNPQTSKKISGDEWFIEFDLQVKDTARGEGSFYVIEDTIRNINEGCRAYISLPLGEEGSSKEETTPLQLLDINSSVTDYPVRVDSSVTLNSNGGKFAAADENTYVIEGIIGDAMDYSTVPEVTRDGFTFKGWVDATITDPTEADVVDLPAEMPYDEEVYNAFWISDVDVTYVLGDGTTVTETVTAGDPFEVPADPTLEGHTFIGWTNDATFKTISGLPATYPTEDATYYAVFDSLVYKVNYYILNDDTQRFELATSGSNAFGDVISAIPASYEVPEGYTLSEAYTDVTLSTKLVDGTTMPAEDVNLYYNLTKGTFDATFMVDGAVYATVPTVYEALVEAPADPEKEGYTFKGWEPYVGTMDEEGKVYEATWEATEYTVEYIVDGTVYEAFDVAYDSDMEVAADPVKEGYTFLGWASAADATAAETLPATMPASDLTYYAVFEVNEYTITFAETGDTVIAPITQDFGTEIADVADPVKTGYTFTGWVDADGNAATVPATMPAEDVALTATWEINEYTVTWVYADDATADVVDTYDFGDAIVVPADPTRTGYTFEGWTPDVEATVPAMDLVYTATWSVNSYNAIFNANDGAWADGDVTKTVATDFGAEIAVPADPQRTGYVFAGWDTVPATMPAEEITITAKWDEADNTPYTVKYYTMDTTGAYDLANPVVDNRTGTTNANVTAVTNVVDGFYVDTAKSVLEGTIAADGSTVLEVYYARNLYTVTFDANNGVLAGDASAEYYHGATVAVPTATREGYKFIGWDQNVSTVAVADADYIAQWDELQYTITFDTDGGTAIDSVTADYGSDVAAPAAVTTKEGYTFGGWAETQGETDAANAVTFPVQMPLNGDTYYAIWTPNKYTITFAETGDSVIAPITQDFGTDVTAPADPVWEGYTFAGWSPAVPATIPAEDITVTATWDVNSYDITWDVDGVETTENLEFGSALVAPKDPVKEGYTFTGWKDADGNDAPATVPAADTTYSAQWDANEYTITFAETGDSVIAPIVADCDEAITAPADPTKTGYTFAGWVDEDGNPATVPATMPAGGMTLKATWTANSDTAFKVVVNYTNYNTGAAETAEFDYVGTTANAIEIVEVTPDPAAANTDYVVLSGITVLNYHLDTEAANEFTGVVAADGSTVLNLYFVPDSRVATFDANGGAWDDGDTTKGVDVTLGQFVKPLAPADPVREGYTFAGWNGLNDSTKIPANRTFYAAWTANSYTITYDIDGVTTDETYEYNALINKPVDPAKEGYTFAGWSPAIPDNMPAEDITVTATWDVNSYDITWDVDGVETTENLEFGSALVAPKDPVKEGYTFTGWKDADGNDAPATVPAADTTYSAQWAVNPYTVTYYVYEPATGKFATAGTAPVDFGAAIPAAVPAAYVAPTGYTLNPAAYTDIALSAALASDATMPAKNIALYYALDANEYDAVFNVDGNEYITVKTEFGAQIVAPADPTKTGYTFAGWTPEVGTMNEEGKTFEATWEVKDYNAIFKANGGLFADGETTTVVPTEFGAAIVAPADPTKTGYTFAGWKTVPATMPAEDVIITAEWTINQYTITFNTDGGSEVGAITQDYNTAITAPANPKKDGYTFAGWDALPTKMPAENTTVTAKWSKNSYTVSWVVDGVKTSEILEFGAAIVKPADPAKEGYTFAGWTPAVASTMPAYNVEYTATWNVVGYTATFDANGGKFADGTTTKEAGFNFGAVVTAPEIPTQTGYTFAGWEPALGTMPAADTTYKAVWTVGEAKAYTVEIYNMDTTGAYPSTPSSTQAKTAAVDEIVYVTPTPTEGFYLDETQANVLKATISATEETVLKIYYAREEYTIVFNGNEGTVNGAASTTADYYYGATVIAPAAVREGYTLTGWNPELSIVAVADATYDAQWEINEYTISFDTDGGSLILPITQDYGTAIAAPADPTKEGYDFAGWVDADGNAATVPATMPAGNVDLTATWTLAKFTVTFYDAQEGGNVLQQTDNDYMMNIIPPVATKTGYDFAGWVDKYGDAVDFDGATVTTPANDIDFFATWNVKTYALNYQAQGGTFADGTNRKSYNVAFGTAAADMDVPEDPVREGYSFKGWNIDLPATMPANPVNRVAQWEINEYNAIFTTEEGVYETIPVVYNEAITAPATDPTKTGYVFDGWSADGVNKLDDLGVIGAEDVEFVALWKEATDTAYTVEHYYMGIDLAYPTDPTRTDSFEGTTNATVTATPDAADNFSVDTANSVLSGTVAADGSLVLAVYYEREINTLTIDVDGVKETLEYPFEAPVDAIDAPEKEGYTFGGWVDADGNDVTVPATMPGDNVEIFASWDVNSYNVTWDVDGDTSTEAYDYNEAITAPADPAKDGYTFAGWTPEVPAEMPAEDLYFTATWTANSNVSYILEIYEMDTEGNYPATATETVTYNDGVVDTVKTVDYVVPTGFALDSASVLTGTVPATGTLVLKAYVIRNTYKLNVDVDGVVDTVEYYYNEAVAAVADPVKEGYVFTGWVDANGDAATIPAIMPANDVTVYATWSEDSFTASFDAGEGTFESTGESVEEIDVAFGDDITAPAENPVREGYSFGGWATKADPETPVTDFGKMDADGEEYVAIWSKTDFSITFYDYKPAAGGPNYPTEKYEYASSTYQFGDTIVFPADPSFDYYNFLGWSETEGDASNLITSADAITMPSDDYVLYAIYEREKVMLVPHTDSDRWSESNPCTTTIDRTGGTVDDYTADSEWVIYGLEEYIKSTMLLEDYIDVTGDGRIEIIYVNNIIKPYTGTGTIVNVYDRMGTEETSDDILVESFRIVIFGDLNGDAVIQALDAAYVFDEGARNTTWSWEWSDDYRYYLKRAADINCDDIVTVSDGTHISDHSIGYSRIDQIDGGLLG